MKRKIAYMFVTPFINTKLKKLLPDFEVKKRLKMLNLRDTEDFHVKLRRSIL